MAQLLKHVHAILGHMHKRTYTDPSLPHLTPTPHTHLTLSPHTHTLMSTLNHSITRLNSLHSHLSHSNHHLVPIPHPTPSHFKHYPAHIAPHCSKLTSHTSYPIPHIFLPHLTPPLQPSPHPSYSHLAVTDNGVPDGLIVLRHHCEPLGVHLQQVKVLEGWEFLETLLRR